MALKSMLIENSFFKKCLGVFFLGLLFSRTERATWAEAQESMSVEDTKDIVPQGAKNASPPASKETSPRKELEATPTPSLSPKQKEKGSSFFRQFGIGATLFPANKFWTVNSPATLFYIGGSLDFSMRLHPRLTLDVFLGGRGEIQLSARTGEISLGVNTRIYPLPLPKDLSGFFAHPYFGIAVQLDVPLFGSSSGSIYTALGMGTYLGGGVELRINSQITIPIDVRFLVQGLVYPYSENTMWLGLRVGVGFTYYF